MINTMMARALAGTALMLAATSASAQHGAARWSNPPGNPQVVGILNDAQQMSFTMFYARCDRAKQTVSLSLLGLKRAPRDRALHFQIDGKRFDVAATANEDMENGGYELSGDTHYGAPVLTALVNAKSMRASTDARALNLPAAGLRPAWTSFKRHCGL